MNIKFTIIFIMIALLLGFSQTQVNAAGMTSDRGSSASVSESDYEKGKIEVDSHNYKSAIKHLKKAVKKNSNDADAHNLLGFSYRKLGDIDKAFVHYNKALAIEPDHLGANEYLGELYVETDQIMEAEKRLAVLGGACSYRCEEYEDLKEVIEKYKR